MIKARHAARWCPLHSVAFCVVLSAMLGAIAFPNNAKAVDVFTDPAGFYKVVCLSNSDTFVSIPFNRPPAAFGKIQSIAGNVITLAGSPTQFAAGQFVFNPPAQTNTFYAYITSGTKEGAYYTITNNGGNTLFVELMPEDLSGITTGGNGDRLQVIPFWTLGSAFPGGQGATVTTSLLSRKTEVLFPDFNGVGINLSPAALFFYFVDGNGTYWRRLGTNVVANFDHQIILPDQYFVVRQSGGASHVTNSPPGMVPTKKVRTPLYTHNMVKQDNFIGLRRPANTTLTQSGLFESGAFVVTTSLLSRQDEVLVFNNAFEAKNKSPSDVYFHFNGAWRKVGISATNDVGSSNAFLAGTGVIIRKATNAASATAIWVNQPNY